MKTCFSLSSLFTQLLQLEMSVHTPNQQARRRPAEKAGRSSPRSPVQLSFRGVVDTILFGGAAAGGSSAALDRALQIVFTDGSREVELFVPGCITAQLSQDGRLLLTCSASGDAAVWSTERGERQCSLEGKASFLVSDCWTAMLQEDAAAMSAAASTAAVFCARIPAASGSPADRRPTADAARGAQQQLLWRKSLRPGAFLTSLAFTAPESCDAGLRPTAAAAADDDSVAAAPPPASPPVLLGTSWAEEMLRMCAETGNNNAQLAKPLAGASGGDDSSDAAAPAPAGGGRVAVAASSDLSVVLTAPASALCTSLLGVSPPAREALAAEHPQRGGEGSAAGESFGAPRSSSRLPRMLSPAMGFAARGSRLHARGTAAFLAGGRRVSVSLFPTRSVITFLFLAPSPRSS